jgi:hypothetical protein
LFASPHTKSDCIEKLFTAGLSPWAANTHNVTLFDLIAAKRDAVIMHSLADGLITRLPQEPAARHHWYTTTKDEIPSHVAALQIGFIEQLRVATPEAAKEASTLLRSTKQLESAC